MGRLFGGHEYLSIRSAVTPAEAVSIEKQRGEDSGHSPAISSPPVGQFLQSTFRASTTGGSIVVTIS